MLMYGKNHHNIVIKLQSKLINHFNEKKTYIYMLNMILLF